MRASTERSSNGRIVFLGRREAMAGFTPRDRLELERWTGQGRRSMIAGDGSDPFAMLYEGGKAWASWAVMRQGAALLLWDCVTFADIGWFTTMQDALAAISGEDRVPWEPLANVIALGPSKRDGRARR